MPTKEAAKLYEDAFIHQYEIDFKENTGKNLAEVILDRHMNSITGQELMPIDLIISILNKMIPEEIQIMSKPKGCNLPKDQPITILTQWRKRELSDLRKVFTQIAREYGYSRSIVISLLKLNHTSIVYYIQEMNKILAKPTTDLQLFKTYQTASYKVKKAYDQYIRSYNQSESDTESDVPALLNQRQEQTEINQCTAGD